MYNVMKVSLKKVLVWAFLLLLLAALALGQAPKQPPMYATCPVHWLRSPATGRRKLVENREFYEYRCPRGDRFWVRTN
jgi:hypothetical protein